MAINCRPAPASLRHRWQHPPDLFNQSDQSNPSDESQSPGPRTLHLPPGEVHVWRISLLCGPAETARHLALLTPDEAARAEAYRFAKDRTAFIVRRSVLRILIGEYLGRSPFRLPFILTAYGQPLLPTDAGAADLRFSVSHSGGVALLALARACEIGVDIEAIRSVVDYCGVAKSFFSRREQEALQALPQEQQCAAFFACWSRKEAYIKARGRGLSIPLDQFDVSLAPGAPPQLLATRDPADAQPVWSLYALDPGPQFAAALAVAAPEIQIQCWNWPQLNSSP